MAPAIQHAKMGVLRLMSPSIPLRIFIVATCDVTATDDTGT